MVYQQLPKMRLLRDKYQPMKKILIVISNQMLYRNFILSDAFSEIEKMYECSYIFYNELPDELIKKSNYVKMDKKFSDDQPQYNFVQKISILFNDHLMRKNIRKSKTFAFRLSRKSKGIKYLKINFKRRPIISIFRFIFYILITKPSRFILDLLPVKFFFLFYSKLITSKTRLLHTIKQFEGNLCLIPTNGADPQLSLIIYLCKKYKKHSHLCVDNWDNLSSKTILAEVPDSVSVWSKQSAKHAKDIQGIRQSDIHIAGCSRYDYYFNYLSRSNNKTSSNFVLFLGTALHYDEERFVNIAQEIISKFNANKSTEKKLELIYRPHPLRQIHSEKIYSGQGLSKLVIMDTAVSLMDENELQRQVELISSSKFVIGGLTSMLLESNILYKKYIAIAIDDEKTHTNQKNAFFSYTHFKGVESLTHVNLCFSVEAFSLMIESFLRDIEKNISSEDLKSFDSNREYFIHKPQNSYKKNILDIISKYA